MRDELLQRRDRLADQHRGGNHHAARDQALDVEDRAECELQRCDVVLQEARDALHRARGLAGVDLQLQELPMSLVPAPARRRQHAERERGLRVAQIRRGEPAGLGLGVVGGLERRRRDFLLRQRRRQHDARRYQGEECEIGVERGADDDEDERERRLHDGERTLAGEELPHCQQVAQHLVDVDVLAPHPPAERGVEDGGRELPVEP
jgi:hypothetical protein